MWVNPPTESSMMIDQDLPQRVCETIGATRSVLTVFFDPREFARVDFLPQNTSSTVAYFANNVVLLLANWHAQQPGEIGHRKLHLHFDNSKCHTTRRVQEQMASYRRIRVPRPSIHPT
jgi:hypothetical protein